MALGDHFKEISKRTGLRLYEPGYGGVYAPDHGQGGVAGWTRSRF